ncbi:MAG: hypothetical protein AAFQ13_00490 [Pseudomonadota bacterium]
MIEPAIKITASSVSTLAALIMASVSGIGAPEQAVSGTPVLLAPSTAQTTTDVRGANQNSCAKWRQFLSSFSLKPAGSNLDQSPDGENPAC